MTAKKRSKLISIYIDPATHKALKKAAEEDMRTLSDFCYVQLAKAVKKKK